MLFKLIELQLGYFAIVKAEESYDMPITVHGHLITYDCSDVEGGTAILANGEMSKELKESNELEMLIKEAIELTVEAVADNFGD